MKKVLNAIGNIFVTLVLIFAVLITVLVISSTKSEIGVPSLNGYAIMNVESNSMEGEKGFFTGDLVIIRLISKEEADNLKVGDVITFWRYYGNERYIETHRIVNNTYETQYAKEVVDGIRIHNGEKVFVTKGDNTPAVDYLAGGELDYATANTIIGVWEGKSIPKLGSAIKFLRSQMGFMVCIVAPLALLFFYELYRFIVTMNEKRKESALAEVAASEDEIRQKAVAEFLAQNQTAAQAQVNTAPPAAELDEEAIKKKTIDEYLARQAAAKKAAEDEEAIKKKAIEEYLAQQATENAAKQAEVPAAEVPDDKTPPTEQQ